MERTLLSAAARVVFTVALGLGAAIGLAALRGGRFGHEIENSLWIVAAIMIALAGFSVSPSSRRAQDELTNVVVGRRFARHPGLGLGLAVTLALAAACLFVIALVVS